MAKPHLPLTRLFKLAGMSKAAFYRWQAPNEQADVDVRSAMHEIALEHLWYGYRPMARELKRRISVAVNHKRVRRLMKLDGWSAFARRWIGPKAWLCAVSESEKPNSRLPASTSSGLQI